LMLGGATNMFTGCAAPPPPWLKEKYAIDIDAEVDQTMKELGIKPLPEDLRGDASTRVAEAAQSLGYDWQPQPKFMNPARAERFDCGAKCMLGCRCGAKWTACEYVDEAGAAGAKVVTRARVDRVLVEGNRCVGVAGRRFEARAGTVVLCAGGIGTPRILQASGFSEAGVGMTMDTTVMVYGFGEDTGIGKEPPMTWSWVNDADGYMLATLADPWLMYPIITMLKGPKYVMTWPRWRNLLGIMIKLKDDISGGVFPDGRISKPTTEHDKQGLTRAEQVCREILVAAGADPGTLYVSPQRGTHPSGTVRLGTMLNEDLRTETPGLYVCDASVFPEALCRPTVLTIIGLAKRLARHVVSEASS
ncbi:MAG TPA: GMC family oxidoreductase, partial [Candidatus Hydrogenedentes bacterium]|nr:GMC family oxidoreductase [Candidatus Hydrogenedentota bacterium]